MTCISRYACGRGGILVQLQKCIAHAGAGACSGTKGRSASFKEGTREMKAHIAFEGSVERMLGSSRLQHLERSARDNRCGRNS